MSGNFMTTLRNLSTERWKSGSVLTWNRIDSMEVVIELGLLQNSNSCTSFSSRSVCIVSSDIFVNWLGQRKEMELD